MNTFLKVGIKLGLKFLIRDLRANIMSKVLTLHVPHLCSIPAIHVSLLSTAINRFLAQTQGWSLSISGCGSKTKTNNNKEILFGIKKTGTYESAYKIDAQTIWWNYWISGAQIKSVPCEECLIIHFPLKLERR